MRLKAFGPIRRSPRRARPTPGPNSSGYFDPRAGRDRRSLRSPHYVSLEGKWRVRHSTTASGGERDFYLPSFSTALWQQTELPNTAPVAGASAARRARAAATACRDSAGAVPRPDRDSLPVARPRPVPACRGGGRGLFALCERTADRLRERQPYACRISDFPGRDRRREYDCYRGVRLLGGQLDGNADSADGRRHARQDLPLLSAEVADRGFRRRDESRFGSGGTAMSTSPW